MKLFRKKTQKPGLSGLLLFVHIPKTAGTSLRFELEKRYQRENIAADYGADSVVTSDIVIEHMYRKIASPNAQDLINSLQSQQKVALVGHYRLSRYAKFFPASRVISIIRDPLLRAASEFLHEQRHNNFDGSFSDFFSNTQMVNRITNLLDEVDEDMIIGTTERYNETLQLINFKLGMRLRPVKKNAAPRGGARQYVSSLDSHTIEAFQELNRDDYTFYRKIDKKITNELQALTASALAKNS